MPGLMQEQVLPAQPDPGDSLASTKSNHVLTTIGVARCALDAEALERQLAPAELVQVARPFSVGCLAPDASVCRRDAKLRPVVRIAAVVTSAVDVSWLRL